MKTGQRIRNTRIFIAAVLLLCLPVLLATVSLAVNPNSGSVAALQNEQRSVFSKSEVITSSTYSSNQWALQKIMAPQAWQVTSGDPSVVIAVLDTGIAKHDDLVGKVIAEVNFSDSPVAMDIQGHGTHVAGIIAAKTNSSLGIEGVAPDCRLMNVKVADESGQFIASALAKGIIWAVDHGAKVINMSLVARSPSLELEMAVNYAWSKGVVVVAAAGNYTDKMPTYPASYLHCISVAATDANDLLAPWSSDGDWVNVTAPGVNIYSTAPFNEFAYESGTSMAAAHVSGVAALLFGVVRDSNGNGFINDEIRATIENSCDKLGIKGFAKGRINADTALTTHIISK